jgi:hypothetical protein
MDMIVGGNVLSTIERLGFIPYEMTMKGDYINVRWIPYF